MGPFEITSLAFLTGDFVETLQIFGRRVVVGLVVGSILALAGVGLTLVYGILRIANFAHGDFLTLGTYLALYFVALLALPATLAWGIGAALVLMAVVALDRFLHPWWIRWRDEAATTSRVRLLSPMESGMVLYVAAVLIVLVAGNRFPVDLAGGWGILFFTAVAASVLVWRALSRRGGQATDPGRLSFWAALGAAAGVASHFLVPLQTAGGLTLAGEIALALIVVIVGALRMKKGAGEDPVVLGVLGVGGLVMLFMIATPILLAVALALAFVAGLSVVLDLLMWRPARRKGAGLVTLIIMAIGLALVLRNTIIILWGGGLQGFPGTIRRGVDILGSGIVITPNQAMVIGVTLVVVLLMHFLLQHTKVGKAMRALSDDMELARISGIDVDRVVLYVWIIGGALVALSGILFAMTRSFTPSLGWHQLLPIFAAVILGGIGNVYGAMVGGFVIGLAMETSVFFGMPPEYRLAVGFGILILVMIFRPRGIFGRTAVR